MCQTNNHETYNHEESDNYEFIVDNLDKVPSSITQYNKKDRIFARLIQRMTLPPGNLKRLLFSSSYT